MSSLDNTSALKIQGAWRKYYESKDSCPICLKIIGLDSCITKCGHKFCTGCLLQSIQNKNTCPLCRNELVQNSDSIDEDIDDDEGEYWSGYSDGRNETAEELQYQMREEIDIAKQKAYDEGIIDGRSLASEDLRIFKEKYVRIIEIMENKIKKLDSENRLTLCESSTMMSMIQKQKLALK